MRFTTMMSVAIFGLSTAALAQVASTPAEQKPEGNSAGNDMAVMDNAATGSTNTTASNTAARTTILAPQAGDPTAASAAPKKR